jgi:transposase
MRRKKDSTVGQNFKEICDFLAAMDLEAVIRKSTYKTRKRKLPVHEHLALWVHSIWEGNPESLGTMVMKRNYRRPQDPRLTAQGLSYVDCHRPCQLFADIFEHFFRKANRSLRRQLGKSQINLLDASVVKGLAPKVARFFPLRSNNGVKLARLKVHSLIDADGALRSLKITDANNNDGQHTDFIWKEMRRNTLLIFDLGYWRFDFLDAIQERGCHFLTRVRQDNRPLAQEWFRREPHVRDYMARLDRYRSNGKRHLVRVVEQLQPDGFWWRWTTNLDVHAFPAEEVADLYRRRWQVEIFFRQLKHVFHLRRLRSSHPNALMVELYVTFIAYMLAHWLMVEAGRKYPAGVGRQYALARVARLLHGLLEGPILPLSELLKTISLYCITPVNKKRQARRSETNAA